AVAGRPSAGLRGRFRSARDGVLRRAEPPRDLREGPSGVAGRRSGGSGCPRDNAPGSAQDVFALTSFTDLVGCRVPLQLAGIGGGISDVPLATAVCEAGGLGMLGGAGFMPIGDLLDAMPPTAPFGVNFLMPFLDRDAVALASKRP